jgi:phage replication-related protein YjqB (UPF0714/DUF867 family)
MRYDSFRTLRLDQKKGVDYNIRIRSGGSGIAVMAIHGGGIEPGTTEIAEAVAGRCHGFYTFSGLKPSGNFCLHITSTRFDEPQGVRLAEKSRTVVVIHGCADPDPVVYIGGRHAVLKQHLRNALQDAGFRVSETVRFPGVNPDNICNRCGAKRGVQLEISIGLRRLMFGDLKRSQRKQPLPVFYRFVAAVQRGIAKQAATSVME